MALVKMDLTKFETILYFPNKEDGSELVVADDGYDGGDQVKVRCLDLKLSDIDLGRFQITRKWSFSDAFYVLRPKEGPLKSNGSKVIVNGAKHRRVFYSPYCDTIFDENLSRLGDLRDLETDGVTVKELKDDVRTLHFRKGSLYEIGAGG